MNRNISKYFLILFDAIFISSIYSMEKEIENLKKAKDLQKAKEICEIAKNPKAINNLKLLLETGMHPDRYVNNDYYATPLQVVIGHRNIEAAELLLKHGANPNILNYMGKSSFHLLEQPYTREDLIIAELLLKYNADPNSKDWNSNTILHEIANNYIDMLSFNDIYEKMINLVLYHGANPYIKNIWENTPIDILKKRGHKKLAERLENAGRNLRAMLVKLLSRGKTPFNRDVASVIAQFRYSYK